MNKVAIEINHQLFHFPEQTAQLLYLSSEPVSESNHQGLSYSVTVDWGEDEEPEISDSADDEPSTIFLNLLVREPKDLALIHSPDYYPNYRGLSPEQRWIYLNWLQAPEQPIPIGYVFVYFYGLERQIFSNLGCEALYEILFLLQHHGEKKASFKSFALNKLRFVLGHHNKVIDYSKFKFLLSDTTWQNEHLLITYHLKHDLNTENMMAIANSLGSKEINKKYIKSDPDLYRVELQSTMKSICGHYPWPFYESFPIQKIFNSEMQHFANPTLFLEEPLEYPNYFQDPQFKGLLKNVFDTTHEATKLKLKELRKNK
jgi:hypothetical protein